MSSILPPHGLQHPRHPCPSLSPRVCSNSCPSSQWGHSTISSSAISFSSCPQSFPESGSFPMNWLFASSGQRTRASASASVLLMNIQGWFPLGLTGLISLKFKELSRVFSNTIIQDNSKASILRHSAFCVAPLSHPYMATGKTIALTKWTFVGKVTPLFFNMLSRFIIAFLPRSKFLLISLMPSPSAVVLEPKKRKSNTVSTFPHLFATKWWHWMPWSSFIECWVLSQFFHSLLSPWSKGSLPHVRTYKCCGYHFE